MASGFTEAFTHASGNRLGSPIWVCRDCAGFGQTGNQSWGRSLGFWADSNGFILNGEAFHDGNPFQCFDLRVMMLINENRAWLKSAWQQCYSLSKLLQHEINPLRHRHFPFDELILLAAVDDLQDEPDEEHP
ncbi:hypothetical protein NBRGN_031_00500 [Nocardia brasiliensis NBRC 14402]|nr:hypothetical protein NBRGN_031_00500 [Nocardia brasiliensis NBRC 14402]SUB53104.1 Uncharacterised protein [Nocardia brasiliensis]